MNPFDGAKSHKGLKPHYHSQAKHHKPQNRLRIKLVAECLLEVIKPWAETPEPKTKVLQHNPTQDKKPRDTKWLQNGKWSESEILGSGGMVAQA